MLIIPALPGNMSMSRMQASMQLAHHVAVQQGKEASMQNMHLNSSQGFPMHGGIHGHQQQNPHLAAGAGVQPYGTPVQAHGAPGWRASDGGKATAQKSASGIYAGLNGAVRPQEHATHSRSAVQASARWHDEPQSAAPQVSSWDAVVPVRIISALLCRAHASLLVQQQWPAFHSL